MTSIARVPAFTVHAGMLFLAAAVLLLAMQIAAAQSYPTRPIRMIAPFSAGGGADTVARLVSQKLSEILGQQVIVDNRPGASNIIGTEVAARAAPDGYTMMIVNVVHAINAGLFRKLPYDSINDFAPIALVASTPFMLVVHPSLPVRSVSELVALAKAQPGKINYASSGIGTAAHLAAEMFRIGAGIRIVHVPYKGITGAAIDTVAGATQIMIASPLTVLAHVKSGKLRALAVTTATRVKTLPELPTIQESGVAGYDFSSWYGLLAPRGVPGPVIGALNQAVMRALEQKDLQSTFSAESAEPQGGTPEQFGEYLKQQVHAYSKLLREIKLQVD